MRVEITGRGANARFVHVIGERDLRDAPYGGPGAAEDGKVTIALGFTAARAIQVKQGETRIRLSIEEVVALFDDLTAVLGLTGEEVEAARQRRAAATDAREREGAPP